MRLCYGFVLALVTGCGGGNGYGTNPPPAPPPAPPPPPPAPGTFPVEITNYQYSPDTTRITVGTPVRWTNNGSLAHTVTADDNSFNSGSMSGPGPDGYGGTTAGTTYDRTFAVAGTYPYHCSLHPLQMKGAVVVSP